MTETAEPQQQPEQTAPEAKPEQQDQSQLPQWARDAITKANKEAAGYRTQVNELKPLADQFKQLDEASKTEQQRLQEALEASNRDRDSNAADALRMRVAIEHGISKDDFDLLGTGDEEALAARAARIAEMRAAAQRATPPPGRPHADLKPGATPIEELSEDEQVWRALHPEQQ